MDRPTARTLLELLVQTSDLTIEETCRGFEECARKLNERATLSMRQLARWMAGDVEDARPPSRRVARVFWGTDFRDLLQPPPPHLIFRPSTRMQAPITSPAISGQPFGGLSCQPLPSFLHEEIELSAQESARIVREAGHSVTESVLEQLNDDVRWLAEEFLRRPPYAVFRPIASLRREVFGLIDAYPRPDRLRELYKIAGQLSALLAHASSDLGQLYAADSNARNAWMCADLSDNRSLKVYTRWVQSNVAYWRGDFPDAAQMAALAEPEAADDSDRLRLLSQQARAFAAMNDRAGADRALNVAQDIRDGMSEGTQPGVFNFAPGKAAYYASEVRITLGGESDLELAVQQAEEAVELFGRTQTPDQSPELMAAAQLDLAQAHLNLGDLDAASVDAQEVLSLPAENRTVPIMGRVGKVDDLLQEPAFRRTPLAVELRDQIETFSAYPAARELPQPPQREGQ
jgi:tetratricopeptide (TPR) repeat protein